MIKLEQQSILSKLSNYHPKWGYDIDKVPETHCLVCGERIGNEPYIEVTTLARHGQMLFMHKRCE